MAARRGCATATSMGCAFYRDEEKLSLILFFRLAARGPTLTVDSAPSGESNPKTSRCNINSEQRLAVSDLATVAYRAEFSCSLRFFLPECLLKIGEEKTQSRRGDGMRRCDNVSPISGGRERRECRNAVL